MCDLGAGGCGSWDRTPSDLKYASQYICPVHHPNCMQVVARQSEGHPEVVLRESPTGAISHKIKNGTVVTELEKSEDLFIQVG